MMKDFLPLLLLSLLAHSHAKASDFFIDSNVFYFSDTAKVSSTTTDTRMLLDAAMGFTLDKNGQWQIGWNYSMHTTSTSGDSEASYSSTEMGPKFSYYFDKRRTWGASFTYNLIVNGSYSVAGGSDQDIRGTSMKVDAGYGVEMTESMRLGLRLVYSMASFKEEIDNTTLTKVSYSRTFLYPAIHLSYLF